MSVSPEAYVQMMNAKKNNDVQQAGSQEYALRLRDLILPVIAGAIAGISPKAAQAVNIASDLYTGMQKLNELRRSREATMQQKITDNQRLDMAVQHIASPDSTPRSAVAHLLAANVPAHAIPDIIKHAYGLSEQEIMNMIQQLESDKLGSNLTYKFESNTGNVIGRDVRTSIGSPDIRTFYDPQTGETGVVIINQTAEGVPKVDVQRYKGVPGEAAGQVLKQNAAPASSGASSYKIIQGIDPNTGQVLYFRLDQKTGKATPLEGVVPERAASPAGTKGAKEQVTVAKTLYDMYKKAVESGDDESAAQLSKTIQFYLSQLPGSGQQQQVGVGISQPKTPQQEAEEYLRRRRGARTTPR